jgi:hypothetical protein
MIVFISACSTGSLVTITTSPADAEVYFRAVGSGDKIELGKTPLRINSKDLRNKVKSDHPIEVFIIKDGYLSENFIATDYYNNNLSLDLKLELAPTIRDGKKVDQIVAGLFECHRLVKSKKTQEAQDKIAKLIEAYPHVSSLHEFQGSIYYVINEWEKAYDSFLMAVKYNEENHEARRMITILKENKAKKD